MQEKRRSQKDFEVYLKAMLEQDYPEVKYNNPDAWYQRALKEKKSH